MPKKPEKTQIYSTEEYQNLLKRSKKNATEIKIPGWYWIAAGLPAPKIDYSFHKTRKWKIDYAWPDVKLAVEIEGGAWTQGRHTRGGGFIEDMEKYRQLTIYGWKLLRYIPTAINYSEIKRLYLSSIDVITCPDDCTQNKSGKCLLGVNHCTRRAEDYYQKN